MMNQGFFILAQGGFRIPWAVLLVCWTFSLAKAQEVKVLADQVTFTSPADKMTALVGCGFLNLGPCYSATVQNPGYAILEDNQYSRLLASPGLLAGLGSYDGEIELQFPATVPADTWSYVRIGADENLLQLLTGGSLGEFLSTALGLVILGEQEIVIDVRNSSGTTVLTRSSTQGFDTDDVRLVQDKDGYYYLAVKPSLPYDRIRLSNLSTALAGLGSEYTLDVWYAFYFEVDPCSVVPTFTSYDGSGINLDLVDLNPPVTGMELAVDRELETASEISLGVVGLAGTVEQLIYFNSPVEPGNEITVRLASGQSLVDLDLLEYVELVAYSDGTIVSSVTASTLLDLDVLGLFSTGEFFDFPISSDDSPIDRIGVKVSSLLGLGVLEGSLQISETQVRPKRPEIIQEPEEGTFEICQGQTVTVSPENKAGGELNWYRMEEGVEIAMGTMDTYTTSEELPAGDYQFSVKSTGAICSGESEPSLFQVKVLPAPSLANFTVTPSGEVGIDENGLFTYVEGINPVILTPTLTDWSGEGEFKWFLDEDQSVEIHHGSLVDGVSYSVDEGSLSISGLSYSDQFDPINYFLVWQPDEGCSAPAPKEVNLNSVARILNRSIQIFHAEMQSERTVLLEWKIYDNALSSSVVLERSGSDLIFKEIWRGNLEDGEYGSFEDNMPMFGDNYYRIRVISDTGTAPLVSELNRVFIPHFSEAEFFVFPNRFRDSFSIGTTEYVAKNLTYYLYSSQGALIANGQAVIEPQTPFQLENLGSIALGEYFLLLVDQEVKHSFHLVKN